jgi:thioredoxin-dependent peroxiredoxin
MSETVNETVSETVNETVNETATDETTGAGGLQQAPDFDLADQHGQHHRLSDYGGRWLVLYFYPADDTPGCTREACDFRDANAGLTALGAAVVGVSPDDGASHGRFASKYSLNFPLLADTDALVAKAYGAWGTKNLYGKVSEGLIRQTLLIDPSGKIVKHWKRVSVDGHVTAVEAILRANQAKDGAGA